MKQIVRCAWCSWQGESPVKKKLIVAGQDYPIECRQCHAIGLAPIISSEPDGEAENRKGQVQKNAS